MKKMLPIALIGAISLMVTGCGKSAVSCDDREAKELVMEIAEPEIKNSLLHLKNMHGSYQIWQELAEEGNVDAQNGLAEIDKQYQEASPKVINIRTISKDDELQLTECSADIGFANGNSFPIDYTLSVTSDNRLYAEVFGLN